MLGNNYSLAKAQLSLATPFNSDLEPWPTPPDALLPARQHLCSLVAICIHTLANLRHIEARRVLLDHTPHIKGGHARPDDLLHHRNPAVRNAIGPTIRVSGNNLFLEQAVHRNAGATTQGTAQETVDAMELPKIDTITTALRQERYGWKPVRRVYIPKLNSPKKPVLGLPTRSDKLLRRVLYA